MTIRHLTVKLKVYRGYNFYEETLQPNTDTNIYTTIDPGGNLRILELP